MKWTVGEIEKLNYLCHKGYDNRTIATRLGRSLTDVHAKRSQLGIAIARCKGIEAKPEFEEVLAPITLKGMSIDVKNSFSFLGDSVLFSMARDWVGREDADEYCLLANELIALEAKYNARIGR